MTITNKTARHNYFLETEETAGMILTGEQVKAFRAGRINITGSYVKYVDGKPFLLLSNVAGSIPLLLTSRQNDYYFGKVILAGKTIIPTEVVQVRGKYKLKISIGTGKKDHDERATDKNRTIDNDLRRAVKSQKLSE